MAIQHHKKTLAQSSIPNMPHLSVNSPSQWNSTSEHRIPMSLSKNLSLKVGCTPNHGLEPKCLGGQSQHHQDQDSSSTKLTGQSHPEVAVVGGTESQDQCISSDSDESRRKQVEGQMNPVSFMGNPAFGVGNLQNDTNQSLTRIPYAYSDPFVGGLYTPYGPQAIIPPQTVVGLGPTRVQLPPDLAEDGPIYVNAKQYHAILRRRQVRAKLEAQNKLIKNRRPYLHESRHRHAVNRVRGSGGRFLSTKNPGSTSSGDSPATSGVNHVIYDRGGTIFNHQMYCGFSGISPRINVFPAGN